MKLFKGFKLLRRGSTPSTERTTQTAPSTPPASEARRGLTPLFVSASSLPLSVATVYRCVRLLGESVANLPLQYLRLKDGIFSEYTTSRLHYLLTVQPDGACSAYDFFERLVQEVLLQGNAYVVPIYSPVSMEVDRLVLCGRGTVSHDTINDLYTINDTINGVSGVYGEDEIIHVKNFTSPFDAKVGVSTLTHAAATLGITRAGMEEMNNRFTYGGNVRGIISGAKETVFGYGEFQDDELEKLARKVGRQIKDNSGLFALPEGTSFTQTSLSSTDMQFLGMMQFSVREVCRFFGVHPSFVFDDTSNNYKSAEMANVAFLSHTLNPILRKIEAEFDRKLIPETLTGKRCFRFDRESLYACDLESRVRYQTQTIAAGIYSVNEWRRKENRPPVEGGDRTLVSANLRGLDELTSPNNNTNTNAINTSSHEEEK